jgi:hypothetical protein
MVLTSALHHHLFYCKRNKQEPKVPSNSGVILLS